MMGQVSAARLAALAEAGRFRRATLVVVMAPARARLLVTARDRAAESSVPLQRVGRQAAL